MRKLRFHIVRATILVLALSIAASAHGSEIEFLSGNKLMCKVISKDETIVKVEVTVSGKQVERSFPLKTIHAVTINDKRYVINEKTNKPTTKPSTSGTTDAVDTPRRTKAEIDALIDKVGRQPPDWFDSTELKYPPTLDLSWPEKAEGGWNNQKNVGQYVWDVINPNANKWGEGVKLMHKLLEMHKDDPQRRKRIMNEIGRMYHDLHEDYARAAFWWRQTGVDKNPSDNYRLSTALAECYWRLGNKPMAVEILKKHESISVQAIKLWADMGDMKMAVQGGEAYGRTPDSGADIAFLHVADGFRQLGQSKEATRWYQRVVDLAAPASNAKRFDKTKDRARASMEALQLFEKADVARVKDGSYEAESLGYEAAVRIRVTVEAKQIKDLRVVQHREKQFYSSLKDTPAKIIAKQGVKGVDATSNATITSEAIINATAKALASGAE